MWSVCICRDTIAQIKSAQTEQARRNYKHFGILIIALKFLWFSFSVLFFFTQKSNRIFGLGNGDTLLQFKLLDREQVIKYFCWFSKCFVNVGVTYPCDACSYAATTTYSLKEHKRRVHEGVKFPCDQCEYVANHVSHLKEHIRNLHEGVRYPCDKCEYSATRLPMLKHHKKSKHEGVRHKCNHCDYSATLISNLNHHIKIQHQGLRYTCDNCEYSSTRQDKLKKHMFQKHGVQDNLNTNHPRPTVRLDGAHHDPSRQIHQQLVNRDHIHQTDLHNHALDLHRHDLHQEGLSHLSRNNIPRNIQMSWRIWDEKLCIF